MTEPASDLGDAEHAVEARDIAGLRHIIALGMDVEAFMRTSVGQAIIARANEEMASAQDKIMECDPFDGKAMAEAQMAYRVPAAVLSWLGEFVESGKNAEAQFIEVDALANGG